MQRARAAFAESDLVILGLHTVFEHHETQGTRAALAAFIHEYKVRFPVASDAPGDAEFTPRTMGLYGMKGTPTTLLIDRAGVLKMQVFGHIDDMRLGAAVAALLASASDSGCDDGVCAIDAG